MKVLLIDVNCKGSSTGKIVYDLYEKLRETGHRAAVCYGRGPLVQGEDIYKFGLDWETNIHAGLSRITGLNGCFSPFSTRRLIRFIAEFQPDVVHIHELHAYFVNIGPVIRYLKKKNIKVVWTFHCAYMYTGKCGVTYACEKWKKDCKHCPRVRMYPKSLFLDFAAPMLRWKKRMMQDLDVTIVTPSQFIKRQVAESYLKDKTLLQIPNGIETAQLFHTYPQDVCDALRQRYGLQDKKLVLAVAPGIMSTQKGGPTILKLSERFTEDNMHFVLIGAKEEDKPAPNVTVLKRTADQQELAQWYSAADVFVICSKFENFPTTCLEAMCCGTPVIGLDSGGAKETVPTPYGKFVEPGDMDALEAGLREQLEKKTLSAQISEAGIGLYDKEVMYRTYLEQYQKKD